MTHARTSLLSILLASLTVLGLTACSSGSSDDGGGGAPPPGTASFAGTWDLAITITASTCSGVVAGSMSSDSITLTQNGTSLADDEPDPQERLAGTVSGNNVALTSPNGTQVTVAMDPASNNARFTGQGTINEPSENCSYSVTFVGTRRGGSAAANFGGSWSINLTFTASTCSGVVVGSSSSDTAIFTQSGSDLVDDESDPQERLSGTVQGNSVVLTNANGSQVTLTMDAASSNARFTGQGTIVEPGASCSYSFTVVGTRQGA